MQNSLWTYAEIIIGHTQIPSSECHINKIKIYEGYVSQQYDTALSY